jgi:hypothetical protein
VGTQRDLDAEGIFDLSEEPGVLVHGLMSSESVWRFAGRQQLTYGELLARQLMGTGSTVVFFRHS